MQDNTPKDTTVIAAEPIPVTTAAPETFATAQIQPAPEVSKGRRWWLWLLGGCLLLLICCGVLLALLAVAAPQIWADTVGKYITVSTPSNIPPASAADIAAAEKSYADKIKQLNSNSSGKVTFTEAELVASLMVAASKEDLKLSPNDVKVDINPAQMVIQVDIGKALASSANSGNDNLPQGLDAAGFADLKITVTLVPSTNRKELVVKSISTGNPIFDAIFQQAQQSGELSKSGVGIDEFIDSSNFVGGKEVVAMTLNEGSLTIEYK